MVSRASSRFAEANWSLVPPRLHHPLERWLVDGITPQSPFLYAVLRNDLVQAVGEASPVERTGLADLVSFLISECPPQAYGGNGNIFAWAEMGGWRGMRNASENTWKIYHQHPWRGRLWPPANGDEDD